VPSTDAQELTFAVDPMRRVSALLIAPPKAHACYVLAHGAGAGMTHPSMASVAAELGERGIATLRYQFPYMQQRSKRPDPPAVCHATVRAAVARANELKLPIIAGGRSFGGRMTSQTQAKAAMPGVRGLAFLAFPLHPAGKPSDERAGHLSDIKVPMLFLQGTRDGLADLSLLKPVVNALGPKATLHEIEGGDHSFTVLKKSGRTNDEALTEVLDTLAAWIDQLA
jgi:uncharacterized protein